MLFFKMSTAFQGAEVVFHMAAPDSSINNYNLQRSVNVEGDLGFLVIELFSLLLTIRMSAYSTSDFLLFLLLCRN